MAAADINANDDNMSEGSAKEIEPAQRQDIYVIFSNEKDLRHHESIRIKASLYTGIALRVKTITAQAMENLLVAIDADANGSKQDKDGGQRKPGDKKLDPK